MSGLGQILIAAGFIVSLAGVIKYGMRITLADIAANAMCAAGFTLVPVWPMAAICAGAAVFAARHWWRRRKRRGRLAALGAKARARIAAMTKRMTERPARPVLRPAPAGAR